MIAWLILACVTPDVAAPTPPPQATLPAAQTPAADAADAADPADPAAECMEKCLRANMARAVDHTVIEADCSTACSGDQKPTLETTVTPR